MALPWAEIATGAASLIGTGAQIGAQGKLNKKNRKWQENIYQRTLDDNISFWQMQNEYNRPEAQMQRFQDAGLNPHLIYGSGGAGAGNAGPISSPDLPNAEQNVADFSGIPRGVESTIATYYDTKIKKAQHNNLQAQNTNLLNDAILKDAQTLKALVEANRGKFDLELEKATESFTKQFREYQAQNMENVSAAQYNKNEHDIDMYPLRKKQLESQLRILGNEEEVKQFHARMARQNLTPSDGLYWRLAEMLLSELPDRFNPLKYKGSLKQY